MVKSSNSPVSKLSHRDIGVRRKAVRTLFEIDSPGNLKAFIPLLDDKDPWFRTKALDAHRMWAPRLGIDSISKLASHKNIDARRCAANMLDKFEGDTSSIAEILFEDEDAICKLKACKALIDCDSSKKYTNKFVDSDDARIRAIALSSDYILKDQLLSALDDSSSSVSEIALSQFVKFNINIEDSKLSKLLKNGINPKFLVPFAVSNGKQTMIDLANHNNAIVRKKLVDKLRNECDSSDDERIKLLIDNDCNIIVGRWLQGRNDSQSDALRWGIIENESVDAIERSRLLERLMGRCEEPQIIKKSKQLINSTSIELLKITAQNLSTAGNSRQL